MSMQKSAAESSAPDFAALSRASESELLELEAR
jgi:hypothetical protein